ncbi:pyridoxal-phosphate dependent enzyme [Halarchaeum sp. CBA1220]|uniref:pyridoxal-phosphate dependent enzyme n=1 Tax=Halarchaeum sp. CBA1220 TaxID=1853682 RepID=UPI000F3A8941|nr:pyridoxal-phosphate dependent enzyme [Halarchaeum sp. CBA1220]QLC34110.1 pyridoxal-phosphate dependent enzyme [Halarchaeum sp. CBA1220]
METNPALAGVTCTDCDESFDAAAATGRCPDCGGILDVEYDLDALDVSRETFENRAERSQWRYRELLPFAREAAVTTNEGGTPLVPVPELADEFGVEAVYVKDEGRNPTGTVDDRAQSVAATAAREAGATDVALASTGDDGQSAAAYAARAGLESHTFVPTRASFTNKAMVNVHGGDMSVVEGRIGDADAAFADAVAEHDDWHPVQVFSTPFAHEGLKTAYFEVAEALDWSAPDHVIHPTGRGAGLHATATAAREFADLGLVDDVPAIHAAQAEGCAPVVRAFEEGRDRHEPWEAPDTICGRIEIPDPTGSPLALAAVRETGGDAVAAPDPEILEGATSLAESAGLELGASSGASVAAAYALAERDAFASDDVLVLVNAGAGSKDDDILRSHLMGKGI